MGGADRAVAADPPACAFQQRATAVFTRGLGDCAVCRAEQALRACMCAPCRADSNTLMSTVRAWATHESCKDIQRNNVTDTNLYAKASQHAKAGSGVSWCDPRVCISLGGSDAPPGAIADYHAPTLVRSHEGFEKNVCVRVCAVKPVYCKP